MRLAGGRGRRSRRGDRDGDQGQQRQGRHEQGEGEAADQVREEFRHAEGQVERLAGVQPGVARRRVAGIEVHLEDLLGSTEALGHVVPGQLDVQPAGPGPFVTVDVEEGAQLGEDVVETPGLAAALAGEGVAVHGVAGPHDGVALGLDRPHDAREQLGDPVGPQAGDERQPARHALGVEALAQCHHLFGRAAGPDLHAHRVVDARHEFDMGPVELTGAVADPDHVGRAVVPIAGEGVHAGEALLVGQDQRLVAREEVDLVQALLGPEVDAARRHEAQGAVDLRGDALVALALAGRRDELLVPQVHL